MSVVHEVHAWGVKGDGISDDTAAFDALFDWIARQLPTDRQVFTVQIPRGTYIVTGPVTIDGRNATLPVSGLRIIAEPGATIKARDSVRWGGSRCGIFSFRNSATPATDFVIEGLTFDGSSFGSTLNATTGIYTTAVTGLTIRNCIFKNLGDTALGIGSSPRNDGIILGDNLAQGDTKRAKDIRIEQCRFINCVRNGISALDVDGLVIEDCFFDNIDNTCIDIEPNVNVQFARNISIVDCDMQNFEVFAVVAIPGGSLGTVLYPDQMEGLKLRGNHIDGQGNGNVGIQAASWINVSMVDNTIIHCADQGIRINGVDTVRLKDNHIKDINYTNAAAVGILVDMTTGRPQPKDVIVEGNTVKNCRGYGVRLIDVDTGKVDNNIVRGYDIANGGRVGIDINTSVGTCKNIGGTGNIVVECANAGRPIRVGSAVTRCVVGFNICQEISTGTGLESLIDNDAASTVHAFNCDDQRTDRLFTSGSGVTPMCGGPVGLSGTSRVSVYEVTIAASAGAGTISVTSDFIKSAPVVNVLFSANNIAAAAMMLAAGGVRCTRTASGFDLIHNGNPLGSQALFTCMGVIPGATVGT